MASFPLYANVTQGDNFPYPDGPLAGGKWTNYGSLTGLQVISGAVASDGVNYCGCYFNPFLYTDQEAFFTSVTDTDAAKYLKVRINGGGGEPFSDLTLSSYALTVDELDVGQWRLLRTDNGVNTEIATTVTGVSLSSGDGMGLGAIGSTITGWKRTGAAGAWTQIITATDSTYPMGKTGLVLAPSTDTIDLWGVGGVTLPPQPGPLILGRGLA